MNEKLKTALVIVLIVAIGLFAVNQTIEYRFNVQTINGPCALCAEQNQDQQECIGECFTIQTTPAYNSIPKINYADINTKA